MWSDRFICRCFGILITAPLGAIGMDLTYQTLLEKEDVLSLG